MQGASTVVVDLMKSRPLDGDYHHSIIIVSGIVWKAELSRMALSRNTVCIAVRCVVDRADGHKGGPGCPTIQAYFQVRIEMWYSPGFTAA